MSQVSPRWRAGFVLTSLAAATLPLAWTPAQAGSEPARTESARTEAASPMSFSLVPLSDPARCQTKDCVEVISAVGEITNDTPQAYLDFLAAHGSDRRMRALVFITSPGGKVVASMKLGTLFRSSGATTVVARVRASEPDSGHNAYIAPSACYSACVYAMVGGVKRVAPPHSMIGIHRMFDYAASVPFFGSSGAPREKVYDGGELAEELKKYAASMGVSPDMIAEAEAISSDSIHIVTPQEMRRWRLAARSF